MSLQKLRELRDGGELSAEDVFLAIASAGGTLAESERESSDALETAIRLLEAKRKGQVPADCEQVIDFLAEECGLYPYIDPVKFNLLTQAIIEAHAVDLDTRLYLHSKQMQILLWLLGGDNVILSAPTSFGKSLLVDAFIAKRIPRTVVMILPTIALIDECRRRIMRNFGDTYNIVTTTSEELDQDRPNILILTQERFIARKDNLAIDLLFVDEFYKLDPDRDDGRFETLNLAVYKALPRAKQCFMAGPHIREIRLGDRWTGNFRFVRTDYRTVSVNIIDRSSADGRLSTFLKDIRSVGTESSLVFTATPGSAHDLLESIVQDGISHDTALGQGLGSWIAQNYHQDWPIAKGTEHGIAVHHGRLPRSLAQLFVRLFDAREIRILICTSTLIEGVNTSAANVFIYDKKINRTDFDFFSFANIRGRVGRMMRHFVGNAYLYHSPPEEVETSVEVPVLADPSNASDYLVANVDRPELSDAGRERQDSLVATSGLPLALIREHGAIGLDLLIQLHRLIREMLAADASQLRWGGLPDRNQRRAIAQLALLVAHARRESTGIHTAPQVAWAWAQLRSISSFPKFLRWFVHVFSREGREEAIDHAFQFLQACEFAFPRAIAATESLVALESPGEEPDYSLFVASLENWFRPAWMKQLEEAGIPVPLSERLAHLLNSPKDRAEALEQISRIDLRTVAGMGRIDQFIVQSALD